MPIPSPNKKAAPQLSAKERIYNTLKDWIVDGTLAPGEKISDVEIAEYFSVSRTPVREAIQRLADQKLIEIFPGRESRVTELNLSLLRQTYIMLADLHGLAVRFSFDKVSEQTIRQLEQINESIAAACEKKDLRSVQMYDQEFHNVFLDLADNDFLTSFSNTLYIHALRTENMYYSLTESRKNTVDEHAGIIQALRERNVEEAVSRMRFNWAHTADILEPALKRQNPMGQ